MNALRPSGYPGLLTVHVRWFSLRMRTGRRGLVLEHCSDANAGTSRPYVNSLDLMTHLLDLAGVVAG